MSNVTVAPRSVLILNLWKGQVCSVGNSIGAKLSFGSWNPGPPPNQSTETFTLTPVNNNNNQYTIMNTFPDSNGNLYYLCAATFTPGAVNNIYLQPANVQGYMYNWILESVDPSNANCVWYYLTIYDGTVRYFLDQTNGISLAIQAQHVDPHAGAMWTFLDRPNANF